MIWPARKPAISPIIKAIKSPVTFIISLQVYYLIVRRIHEMGITRLLNGYDAFAKHFMTGILNIHSWNLEHNTCFLVATLRRTSIQSVLVTPFRLGTLTFLSSQVTHQPHRKRASIESLRFRATTLEGRITAALWRCIPSTLEVFTPA